MLDPLYSIQSAGWPGQFVNLPLGNYLKGHCNTELCWNDKIDI